MIYLIMINLVVGAGISGATIARLLAESGEKTYVIDSRSHIAGNARDHRDPNGIMIHDYGSHIFHTENEEVWDFVCRFAEFNEYEHRVRGMIEGKETCIPFNLDSLHDVFPKEKADLLEHKLLECYPEGTNVPISEFKAQDDPDLEELAQYVYDHVFKYYTTKQWGKAPDDVDGAVTARVPVRVGRDPRYFTSPHQGIPTEGYEAMIRNMLDHPNIDVQLDRDFLTILDPFGFDRIYYTGPVDELMGYSLGELPYRSERFEVETLDVEHFQDNAVVNYPDSEEFTRIHEYKYYLGDVSPKTVIAREYPEPFVRGKNERYYPIPGEDNMRLHDRYVERALDMFPHLVFLGRLGDYRYYDMDKAVARAIEVFRETHGE